MIPGTPPRDYAVDAGSVREEIANCLQMLAGDSRIGLWERRKLHVQLRQRLLVALQLLDAKGADPQ